MGIVLVVLGVLALLGLAFSCLDFRVARSETTTDSAIARSPGVPQRATLPPGNATCLVHVESEESLGERLRNEVLDRFARAGRISARALDRVPAPDDHPVLRMAITNEDRTWTPVWARAQVRVDYIYASHTSDLPSPAEFKPGDSIECPVRQPVPDDAPIFPHWMRGHVSFDHRAWGLVSRVSFRNEVVRMAAARIVDDVQDGIDKLVEPR